MEEGDSEKAYLLDPTEDLIFLSDELDIDLPAELPEMGAENEHVQPAEEEEEVEVGYPALAGKMIDPVRIYLKEMGSFPLLTREGEVEVAKKIENGQQELLRVVLSCPISIKEIVTLELDKVADRLKEHEISLTATPAALERMAELGYDPEMGARPLKRVIQQKVEDVLSDALLSGTFADGDAIMVDFREHEVVLRRAEEKIPAAEEA